MSDFCDAVSAAQSQAMTAGCVEPHPVKKAPNHTGDCFGSCLVNAMEPVRDVARVRIDGPAPGDRSVVFRGLRVLPDEPPPRSSEPRMHFTEINSRRLS